MEIIEEREKKRMFQVLLHVFSGLFVRLQQLHALFALAAALRAASHAAGQAGQPFLGSTWLLRSNSKSSLDLTE